MTIVESMSARLHVTSCFHVTKHPKTVYKIVFPEASEQQVREYIVRCCGSCLAWAVNGG